MANYPTIGDVIREEKTKLQSAMEREKMVECGDLRDWQEGKLGAATNGIVRKHYIWLGGFDRFAEISYITRDWWVHEPTQFGQSWCCCPDVRVYRKK